LLLHRQIGFDVAMRRDRAFVAEPECHHGNIDTALQQMHGGCQWQNKIPQKWRLKNPQAA